METRSKEVHVKKKNILQRFLEWISKGAEKEPPKCGGCCCKK